MVLAGDVGGTSTRIGLYDSLPARPRPVAVREFDTLKYDSLTAILKDFASEERVGLAEMESACFGVAGPVVGHSAALTNVPWTLDARVIAADLQIPNVSLLNDLEAMAYAVPLLHERELHILQQGEALRGGNIALIAAGTGLGEALLHNVEGRFIPSASEGGHADFAARTEAEIAIVRDLTERLGRAEIEAVVSGTGLMNIYRTTHAGSRQCSAGIDDPADPGAPAAVSGAALEQRCPGCVEALGIFVEAYGAEAGNLALRSVATGGVYIGGGIAPKILPALADGRFMRAFMSKGSFEDVLRRMPVHVILDPRAGLLGAAIYAAGS
jgi:glucokinase